MCVSSRVHVCEIWRCSRLWLISVYSIPVPSQDIREVTGLTLFEDVIYWTDEKSKSLNRAHKTSGAQGAELLRYWRAIHNIKVYHPLRQPDGNCLDTQCVCLHAFERERGVYFLIVMSKCALRLMMLTAELRGKGCSSGCWVLVSLSPLQCPNTSVRWPTEAAATCVCSPPGEVTGVPAPPTSTWLQKTRPAFPTAQPARSVALFSYCLQKYLTF